MLKELNNVFAFSFLQLKKKSFISNSMDYFFYHTYVNSVSLYKYLFVLLYNKDFDDMASGNTQQSMSDAKFKAMFETEDEKFKKLLECLEPLRENQVQVDGFTLSDLYSFCLTAGKMVKHIQVLTTIQYKDVRDNVLVKANSLGICPLKSGDESPSHLRSLPLDENQNRY